MRKWTRILSLRQVPEYARKQQDSSEIHSGDLRIVPEGMVRTTKPVVYVASEDDNAEGQRAPHAQRKNSYNLNSQFSPQEDADGSPDHRRSADHQGNTARNERGGQHHRPGCWRE